MKEYYLAVNLQNKMSWNLEKKDKIWKKNNFSQTEPYFIQVCIY